MTNTDVAREDKFVPSTHVRAVQAGAQAVLFCERSQRLSTLNESAAWLWRAFASGLSFGAAVARFCPANAAEQDARALVGALLHDWQALGYLTPVEVVDQCARTPFDIVRLGVGEAIVELRFHGDADASGPAAAFAPFRTHPGAPTLTATLVGRGAVDYVFVDDAPLGAVARREVVPRLKALLSEHFCRTLTDGFVAHGALACLEGRSLFLQGDPGAGKSTLTLALLNQGFAYGGDDIVRINADGRALGIPFPCAAKSSGWDVVRPHVPGFDDLPVYARADGALLRYVTATLLDDRGPQPIDLYIALERKEGHKARLDDLSHLEALSALLESGYSPRGAVSADTLDHLAQRLSAVRCARLRYNDLHDAVALLRSALLE